VIGAFGWLETLCEEIHARVHVLAGLYPGAEMQQKYLPNRHYNA
jgi:hypothetical protein